MMSANPTGSGMENFRRNVGQLWGGLQPSPAPRPDTAAENNDESTSAERKGMMLREAGRAFKAWLVIYGFLFLLLLGYKWQTKDYYQAEYDRKLAEFQQQQQQQLEQLQGNNHTTTKTPWWTVQELRLQEAMTKIRDLGKHQDAELKGLMKQQSRVQEMKVLLEQLGDVEAGDMPKRETETQQLGAGLLTLLHRGALSEIPSATALNRLFGRAIADLKDVVQSAEKLDWATVRSQLSAELPAKQASIAQEGVALECPAVSKENSEIEGPSIPPEAARQSDLEGQLLEIEALLDRRINIKVDEGLPGIVAPSVVSSLEISTRTRIETTLHEIIKVATSSEEKPSRSSRSSGSSSSCLDREDVLEIVESGLLALQQHANLRNVLRKKAIELDPSATSLILDADLPLPKPKIPQRETKNLARLLDTPLVLQLAQGIDQLIEMAGGYNDHLDQWLDSVAGGRESVGEMLVRHLLEESAKIEIPSFQKVVEQHLPREAQGFLKKSKLMS